MDEFLKKIIVEAGKVGKKYFDAGVTHRTKANLGDLLTDADIAVNDFLVESIHKEFPDHHIHTEENAKDINPGAAYEWVIDPIDGTRNFAMGIPMWCTLIAVLENGQTKYAAIYNVLVNELFFAERGKGAFLNAKPIHVNGTASFDYCFAHMIASQSGAYPERYRAALGRFLVETTGWLHSFGTMLGAAYVASGGIDFFVHNAGKDHDYLAPALICEEAGAKVTDAEGNPWMRYRQDIVIANPVLHPKILELMSASR